MAKEQGVGCVRPTAAIAVAKDPVETKESSTVDKKEVKMIQVGQPAPDFSAPGYHKDTFLSEVKLSDYAGKWRVLCFYPGDFTFV
jgi:peroxiredoxin (alkyl hydroperoxide reductase subunit C)